MKKAPTILQVIPWLDSGGVERGTVDIAASLRDAGARALVAAECGRLAGALEELGGELLEFDGRTKNPLKILFGNVRAIPEGSETDHSKVVDSEQLRNPLHLNEFCYKGSSNFY